MSNNLIEVVDPTRLRDSLQCLRLYYWRHERGLVPNKPQLPLIYGSAIHACMAKHYEGGTSGESLAAFEEVWKAEVLPFEHGLQEEDPKRNPVRWAETFLLYKRHYNVEPFTVLKLGDRPAVEIPFFLPLNDWLALCGIIDLLVKYLNQIMVVDHKTTSVTYQSYFESFNPNHQFTTYMTGATELLGEPVTTTLVNCIVVHPTQSNPEKLFMRVPTTRSKWQLDQFKEEMTGWWSIVRDCRRTGNWPRNDDRCQRWAGGCAYHPLCTEIQADFRKLKPSQAVFREQIWDPIQDLRDHGLNPEV